MFVTEVHQMIFLTPSPFVSPQLLEANDWMAIRSTFDSAAFCCSLYYRWDINKCKCDNSDLRIELVDDSIQLHVQFLTFGCRFTQFGLIIIWFLGSSSQIDWVRRYFFEIWFTHSPAQIERMTPQLALIDSARCFHQLRLLVFEILLVLPSYTNFIRLQ